MKNKLNKKIATALTIGFAFVMGLISTQEVAALMIGDHFYTTSSVERDLAVQQSGYHAEGIAAYVFPSQTSNAVPLYRLLKNSNGDHFYTTSMAERDNAIQQYGYHSEGIACYLNSTQVSNTIPLYRLLKNSNGDHFYTTSIAERDTAVQHYGYHIEGVSITGFVFSAQVAGAVPLFRLLKVSDPQIPQSPPIRTPPPPLPKMPQLTFTNTSLGPTTAYPKPFNYFYVAFSFANIGKAETGKFTIRMILTDKGDLSTQTYDISTPSYAPGMQDYFYWPFPNGLKSGSYVIDAYLDITDQVHEPVEGLVSHHSAYSFTVN